MEAEAKLVDFLIGTELETFPDEPLRIIKNIIMTVIGTTVAGSTSQGCLEMLDHHRAMGGREEATVLVHGGKLPAANAALVNSVMARALDYCDAMAPGVHIGSSTVPSALAAAELAGGCSGRDFLTALALGVELSSRLNLTEAAYDGFDPTGVCSVFAATAAAGRILGLNRSQMWHALALAFNKCGGSFQANIDGSLAVRIIQGWVSQNAISCVQFARAGITGPQNFLEGVYGYFHLFGRDRIDPGQVTGQLGERWELRNVVFKKYPSCGLTQACTEATLALMAETGLRGPEVAEIQVRVPPYAHKLVGHQFRLGENPRVNAQFSIQYCVANALLRGHSVLPDFEEDTVADPQILSFIKKIKVTPDPQMDERGHTSVDVEVFTAAGQKHLKQIDIPPGFPGNPLSQEDHLKRYRDCIEYAPEALAGEDAETIPDLVNNIGYLEDIRTITSHLLSRP